MKSRDLAVPVLAAAVAACLWSFLRTERHVSVGKLSVQTESDGATKTAAPGDVKAPSEISNTAAGKKTAVNWKRLAALGGSEDAAASAPQVTPEDIARFLAKHGETAVNLVAAYAVTHDRRLLDRALELFPSNPLVLMNAIRAATPEADATPDESRQTNLQRAALIERFKTADPNNPLPWIFSAEELFKTKQNEAGVAEIRAALERPGFYAYFGEQWDAAQQLYVESGVGTTEANFLAMAALPLPQMSAANQASRSLAEWQKSAADSGDSAAVADAIRLNYDLGRTFATPEASRTLIGQLVGIAMEKRALEALPADAQPDWLAVTPAQRLAEIENQRQAVKDLTAAGDWIWLIQAQDENLLAEYLRRNRNDGEMSALAWLKTQKK